MRGVILGVVILLLAGCDQTPDQPEQTVDPAAPINEQTFISTKVEAERLFDSAPNDIIKYHTRDTWREKVACSVLSDANFVDWIGTIKSISSDGALIVDLGNSISLEGSNGSASPVFAAISKMREGDKIIFSGTFVSDDPKCPFQVIALPWGDGAIKTPDFGVTFLSVNEAPN